MEVWNALSDNQVALLASTVAVAASFLTLVLVGRRPAASTPTTRLNDRQTAGTVTPETDARAA